jgi:hypothetical protein
MHTTPYSFLFLVIFFISCNNSSHQISNTSDSTIQVNGNPNKTGADSIDVHQHLADGNTDTIVIARPDSSKEISVKDWSIDDFIINKRDRSSKAVRSSIEYAREQWKNVKNPFVATYRGCEFGDYFHLNFEDANGKKYDFGFGNNSYGKFILYNKTDYADNPAYLGKAFNIYWDWKISSFPCCDGEYHMVKAYLPSITKLELTGTNTTKK